MGLLGSLSSLAVNVGRGVQTGLETVSNFLIGPGGQGGLVGALGGPVSTIETVGELGTIFSKPGSRLQSRFAILGGINSPAPLPTGGLVNTSGRGIRQAGFNATVGRTVSPTRPFGGAGVPVPFGTQTGLSRNFITQGDTRMGLLGSAFGAGGIGDPFGIVRGGFDAIANRFQQVGAGGGAPQVQQAAGPSLPFGGALFTIDPRISVRPKRLVMVPNPMDPSKIEVWRHMGRPVLFTGDIAHCRRVSKTVARASRALPRRSRPR